jgi:O-succinylbenzoic acid--CoA ligase
MDYKEFKNITLNNKLFSEEEILEMDLSTGNHLNEVLLFLKSWFDESEEMEVQTSGSTGKPKLITISKQSFVESAKNTCDYLKLDSETKALLCIPVKYIGGKMMVIRALFSGYNLIVQEPSSNPLKALKEEINFIAITPMQAQKSLTNFPKKLEEIKTVIIGGGSVSEVFSNEITSFTNSIFSTYGMTETVSHIALKKLSGENKTNNYNVFPAYSISKNDENCLVIDCPTLSSKKIITNDIVELMSANKFRWLGRIDNVINSGGIKLYPEEIEKKIKEFLPENTFYVTSQKDNLLTEKVILVILRAHSDLLQQKDWDTNLSQYETPKATILEEEINFTETGKIIRKKY